MRINITIPLETRAIAREWQTRIEGLCFLASGDNDSIIETVNAELTYFILHVTWEDFGEVSASLVTEGFVE